MDNKVNLMTDPRLQVSFPEQMMINLITIRANVISLLLFSFPTEASGKRWEGRSQRTGMREKKKFPKASMEAEKAFRLQGFTVHPEVFLRC